MFSLYILNEHFEQFDKTKDDASFYTQHNTAILYSLHGEHCRWYRDLYVGNIK